MEMTNWDKDEIKKAGAFLEKFGYIRKEDSDSIAYTLNNIRISIVYPPYEDRSEVDIKFIKENKYFDVDWIAFVRGEVQGKTDNLTNVKELLKFIEKNYPQIIDYQYCLESEELANKYIEEHWEKFGGAHRNF